MKLSVFYEHIFEAAQQSGKSVEWVLGYAKSCGIDLLECDLWRLSDREEQLALFRRCGMGVSCIYSHFDFLHDSAEISEKKGRELLKAAEYFGAGKVLCLPGLYSGARDRDGETAQFIGGISWLCDMAREYGVAVTIEDFDDINSPCCRMRDIKALLDGCEGLRYTFDTGNFRYCLEDAEEAYGLLRDKVAHVHLKDRSYDPARRNADNTNGKPDLAGEIMYPAEVGGGIIGAERLIKRLLSDGYDGIFAIEHFGAADQLAYMKKSAESIMCIMGEV